MPGLRSRDLRVMEVACETKCDEDGPCNGGLVAKAQAVLDVLNCCHDVMTHVASSVLPPAPACDGSGAKSIQPTDLTTLLDIALCNANALRKRLAEVDSTLRG